MNAVDYILDAVLIATIFLQLRGRRLTPRNLLFPVVIVVYFLLAYLEGVPTAGHDPYLIGGGIALGLVFGVGAGVFTRVSVNAKGIYAKAGVVAASFWTLGVVLRTAFSLYASDGGASADHHIAEVMHSWDITSPRAIVACLLLMVLVEVGSRQLIVGARYVALRRRSAALPDPAARLASGDEPSAGTIGTAR
jgi:hypothetical protein